MFEIQNIDTKQIKMVLYLVHFYTKNDLFPYAILQIIKFYSRFYFSPWLRQYFIILSINKLVFPVIYNLY